MESESECTAGSSAKRMRLESATGVSGENQQVTPRYIATVCVWGGSYPGTYILVWHSQTEHTAPD